MLSCCLMLHAGAGVASVDLAQPDHAVSRGNVPLNYRPRLPGLPPGHRVVALGEIDGMPHPIPSANPVLDLTLVPARQWIASASRDGTSRIWDTTISITGLVANARRRVSRELGAEERRKFMLSLTRLSAS